MQDNKELISEMVYSAVNMRMHDTNTCIKCFKLPDLPRNGALTFNLTDTICCYYYGNYGYRRHKPLVATQFLLSLPIRAYISGTINFHH